MGLQQDLLPSNASAGGWPPRWCRGGPRGGPRSAALRERGLLDHLRSVFAIALAFSAMVVPEAPVLIAHLILLRRAACRWSRRLEQLEAAVARTVVVVVVVVDDEVGLFEGLLVVLVAVVGDDGGHRGDIAREAA